MKMAVWYELWTLDTGNMVADYDTEADALAEVQAYVAAHGREAVSEWTFTRNGDSETDFQRIAEGSALATLALRARAGAASVDAPGTMHSEDT
jgi:hypothetical protein